MLIRRAAIWALLFALVAGGWFLWQSGLDPSGNAVATAEKTPPKQRSPQPSRLPEVDKPRPEPARSDFDFYVLALSWSPTYCAIEDDPNDFQCGGKRAYGFVVHGLWPQYERGYPEDCDTGGEDDVPPQVRNRLYDMMPSAGLIRYQWRKHGACSGLSQADYFDVVQAARRRVAIPAQFNAAAPKRSVDPKAVERAFVKSNPGLPADGIAVTCKQRHLEEVRICMTKGLEFRACAEVDSRDCGARQVEMPAAK